MIVRRFHLLPLQLLSGRHEFVIYNLAMPCRSVKYYSFTASSHTTHESLSQTHFVRYVWMLEILVNTRNSIYHHYLSPPLLLLECTHRSRHVHEKWIENTPA